MWTWQGFPCHSLFFQLCVGEEGEVGKDRQEKNRGFSREGEDDSPMVGGQKAHEKAWKKKCGHGKYGDHLTIHKSQYR